MPGSGDRGAAPLKIDVHTHIIPENLPDLAARYGYEGFIRLDHHAPCKARMMVGDRFFREIEDNCWSPRRRIEDCDRDDVHVQVLSTIPVLFAYWAQPKDTLDLSKFLNDHIAGVVAQHPDRFIGLGTIPMQDPDLAIDELERCMGELGLAGIEIGSHVNDWNLDAPELLPVFEKARDLGAAVFVHPWDMVGQEKMPRYWLPWLVGMPAESSLAICSMIFGGVFDKVPGLRICFAHGGGAFPATLGRIERGWTVRPDLCAVEGAGNPRSYLQSFYIDALVHDPAALRSIVDLMGVERIACGSDYPFPLGESRPGEGIEKLSGLDDEERLRLLSGTALEFLDIDGKRFRP